MIQLLRAELNRLRSRRLSAVAALVVLVAIVVLLVFVNSRVDPLPAADQAVVQAEYDRGVKGWTILQRSCADGTIDEPEQCDMPEPLMGDFGGQLSLRAAVEESLPLIVTLIGLMSFLVGASLIGAEYSTGAIGNWVTYLPRRGRVFTAKLVALASGSALVSLVASALLIGASAALVRFHDGAVRDVWPLLLMGGRGALTSVALVVVGFCVALLSRNTAAALGGLIGYLFLWYIRPGLIPEVYRERLNQWSPEGNLKAILENGFTSMQAVERPTPDGPMFDFIPHSVTLTQGLVYWSVLLLLLIGASLMVFRRRDLS